LTDYPAEYESTALLRDGTPVFIRPIRPQDDAAVLALHGRLSRRSVYFRFFSPVPRLTRDQLEQLVKVDYVDAMAFVAERDDRIIGFGHYYRIKGTDHAEVAFTVEDAYQGRGVGTLLLQRLIDVARSCGIRVFEADVLGENTRMLGVFKNMGFDLGHHVKSGVVHVLFRIDPTADAVARAEARERVAVTSSLERVLAPRSIAVIGASRQPGAIGHEIFRNLISFGFQGPVYPVNPRSLVVASVHAYTSVAEVPGHVDLAIIAVPAPVVRAALEDCAAHDVKAVVVISGGFAETGASGQAAQDDLARFVSSHGMRMLGPNCLGLINTDPDVRMNATFSPVSPLAGRVAMADQYGALGTAVLPYLNDLGVGISSGVTLGNTADISANDLLQWWENDPGTSVVLLYLEHFGDARRFARLARRIAARKPIVAIKPVRAGVDQRDHASQAAQDHVEEAASGLFAQAGVIRTRTLEELGDVATLLAHQPVPLGNRVAILTNAEAPGALAVAACEAEGLAVGPLTEDTREALRRVLSPTARVSNPVDMAGDATAERYGRGLELLLADPLVDAVIVILVPPLAPATEEVASAIVQAAATTDRKPIVSCFLSARGIPEGLGRGTRRIPSYVFPESAVLALAHAARYGAWRRQPSGIVVDLPGIDRREARRIVEATAGALPDEHVRALLGCYGIRTLSPASAHEPSRVVGPPLIEPGHDVLVGVATDRYLGPVVSFALGSLSVELLRDVVFRITPITDRDAREMVRAVRSFPLLEGWRGSPVGDVAALEDLILRVSAMVEDIPELVEMELNPVRVLSPGDGVIVRQAQIKLKAPPSS
jgi:acyl-CoA synthetase (NDP forming)/GNAT superfamily N-acetyltransferase